MQAVLNLGSLQNSHEGRITCLGVSADGSALCTGSWDTNLKVRIVLKLRHLTLLWTKLILILVLEVQ